MGFYVPYVIDGSKHSARLFRRSFQKQVGEGSGVDRPGDLKVQALSVPGTGFRVAPGGGVAQSRDTSVSARESYGPVLDRELVVADVPGTGSQSGRRDLVILEITDPEMESRVYPAPTSPEGWQDGDNFVRVTVIPDVDSLVLPAQRPVKRLEQITSGVWANVTGITLAAINWPASTATIGPAMVEDLRRLQRPRESVQQRAVNLVGAAKEVVSDTRPYPLGQQWPVQYTDAAQWFDVPEWAVEVALTLTVGYRVPVGSPVGEIWMQLGQTANPDRIVAQGSLYDARNSGGVVTGATTVADTLRVPLGLRGTRQQVYPMANVGASVPAAARIYADWATSVKVEAVFRETIE